SVSSSISICSTVKSLFSSITILLTPIRVVIDNLVISASPLLVLSLVSFSERVDKFRLLLWLPGSVRARKRAGWDSNPRFAAPQAAVLVLARLPAPRTSTESSPYNELGRKSGPDRQPEWNS